MKKIHLIIACIISFFCGSCNTPTAPEEEGPTFTSVSVEEFAKCIEGKNVVILDVRTDNEYNAGHIENAINIDYYKNDFEEQARLIPYDMRPKGMEVPYRCCVYKERAIIKAR